MPALIPTKGAAGSRNLGIATGVEFFALGPFSKGSILRRVSVVIGMVGEAAVQVVQFHMAVTASADPTAQNFDGGNPLLDFGDTNLSGRPSVIVGAIQSLAAQFEFFPGWLFDSGAQWLLVRANNLGVAVTAQIFVACEVWRQLEDVKKLVGVGGGE